MATASPFPFALAPDIVRAHQKDAFFSGHLANSFADLVRRLAGARTAHLLGPELRSLAALVYLGLTTLPGNRTLGEEYCDLVHVCTRHATARLPSMPCRAAYVALAVIAPYFASRALPLLRSRIRAMMHRRLARLARSPKSQACFEARLLRHVDNHLSLLTSPASLHALTLALFYFSGTYYELSKRLLSLRYVLTHTLPQSPDRAGYEVLGVLLAIQLALQAYLHVRSLLARPPCSLAPRDRTAFQSTTVDVSLDHTNSYSANSDLLLTQLGSRGPQPSSVHLAATTHTPLAPSPRFDLAGNRGVMAYIKGLQQRKCTLCLEELKDPAATQCGHVFCWQCICDWVREKPECPLCRGGAMVQHIIPLRTL
ncbi:hypothetical protein CDD82_1658 [Ophiocordyceps australis]|uniref:RING-type E3 ubiquitin transferase n=1 Tax=Ophiocordyceps australis TaxID=1399860 RepID=A0A2C5YA81_9HYPO|nr:hypothetical protein CDD82_1658 [Ophiocordyceps australis]